MCGFHERTERRIRKSEGELGLCEQNDRGKQGILRWCGQVKRMEEGCLVKIIGSNVKGVRLKGEPRME